MEFLDVLDFDENAKVIIEDQGDDKVTYSGHSLDSSFSIDYFETRTTKLSITNHTFEDLSQFVKYFSENTTNLSGMGHLDFDSSNITKPIYSHTFYNNSDSLTLLFSHTLDTIKIEFKKRKGFVINSAFETIESISDDDTLLFKRFVFGKENYLPSRKLYPFKKELKNRFPIEYSEKYLPRFNNDIAQPWYDTFEEMHGDNFPDKAGIIFYLRHTNYPLWINSRPRYTSKLQLTQVDLITSNIWSGQIDEKNLEGEILKLYSDTKDIDLFNLMYLIRYMNLHISIEAKKFIASLIKGSQVVGPGYNVLHLIDCNQGIECLLKK